MPLAKPRLSHDSPRKSLPSHGSMAKSATPIAPPQKENCSPLAASVSAGTTDTEFCKSQHSHDELLPHESDTITEPPKFAAQVPRAVHVREPLASRAHADNGHSEPHERVQQKQCCWLGSLEWHPEPSVTLRSRFDPDGHPTNESAHTLNASPSLDVHEPIDGHVIEWDSGGGGIGAAEAGSFCVPTVG